MKELSKKWMYTQFPKNKYYLSFPQNQDEQYLKLYSYYYELCLDYWMKKLNLKQYDIKLKEFHLPTVSENDMDIYQYLSSTKLTYLYLHNNVYLEQLAPYEIQQICDFMKQEDPEFTSKKEKFVEKTFPRCFLEGQNITGNSYSYYGPSTAQFLKPSNAIIIGFRRKEIDPLDEASTGKQLQDYLTFMEEEFSKISPFPVSVIHYKSNSTISVQRNSFNQEEKNLMTKLNSDQQKLKKYL